MDKKGKFWKISEMMKSCFTDEGDMADCCSMMKKMMRYGIFDPCHKLGTHYVIIKHEHFRRCLLCSRFILSLEKTKMELSVKHIFAVLLWILWCTLHSTLIATPVTDHVKKKLADRFRFYRLFFNAASLATLLPVVYYSVSIREAPVFRWGGHLMIVKYLLLATGITLFVAGAKHYSMSQFLGIRQIKTGRATLALSEYDTFDTSGILSAIRHPWYTASIMVIWARDISLSTLLGNMVISAYFIIGTILEERKLLLEFGERYREYQKNVSMFIPYKWLKTKIAGDL